MTSPTIPGGGSTGIDHESSASIDAAADWLLSEPDRTGQAILPEMRQRFGLTSPEAIEAIREANKRRQSA